MRLATRFATITSALVVVLALSAPPALAQVPGTPVDDLIGLGIQGKEAIDGLSGEGEETGEEPADGSGEETGSEDSEEGTGDEGTGDGTGDGGDACGFGGITDLISGGLTIGDLVENILACGWQVFFENTIGDGLDELGEALSDAAFELEVPDEGSQLIGLYEDTVDKVKGALIVGVLLLALGTMLQSANYTTQYAFLSGLPKIVFAALALAFFPEFVRMVAELSGGLAFDIMSEAELSGSLSGMIETSQEAGTGVLGYIGLIAMLCMGLLVLVVAVVRNMLFTILFLMGPLALVCSFIPGLSPVTYTWFRAVMACFVVSLLFCIEVLIGSWITDAPELVFGPAGSVVPAVNVLAVILLFYIMWQTPWKVLAWAFQGHVSPGRSPLSGIANSLKRASTRELSHFASSALKGALGATMGGAAGAAMASSAGRGGMASMAGSRVGKKAGQTALGFGGAGGATGKAGSTIMSTPGKDRGMRDLRPQGGAEGLRSLARDEPAAPLGAARPVEHAPGARRQGGEQQSGQHERAATEDGSHARYDPRRDVAAGQAAAQGLAGASRSAAEVSYLGAGDEADAAQEAARANDPAGDASGYDAAGYHAEVEGLHADLAGGHGDPYAGRYGGLGGSHEEAARADAAAAERTGAPSGSRSAYGADGGVVGSQGLGQGGIATLALQAQQHAGGIAQSEYRREYDNALQARHAMAGARMAHADELRGRADATDSFAERSKLRSQAVKASQEAAGIRADAPGYADDQASRAYGLRYSSSVSDFAHGAAQELASERQAAVLQQAHGFPSPELEAARQRRAEARASLNEAVSGHAPQDRIDGLRETLRNADLEVAGWGEGGALRENAIADDAREAYDDEYHKVYSGITGHPPQAATSSARQARGLATTGERGGAPPLRGFDGGQTEFGLRGGKEEMTFKGDKAIREHPSQVWVVRKGREQG